MEAKARTRRAFTSAWTIHANQTATKPSGGRNVKVYRGISCIGKPSFGRKVKRQSCVTRVFGGKVNRKRLAITAMHSVASTSPNNLPKHTRGPVLKGI